MREAFEEALRKDHYDEVTRMVFADWLDENGFDDEATAQRKWTREKQESEDWLREFVKDVSREDDWDEDSRQCDLTYESLIAAAKDGDDIHFPYDTPDRCYSDRMEMEKHLAIILDLNRGDVPHIGFRCGC